ncbi:hypothetical protein IM40_11460 (plasmid) [Candidatus Paracaedimonas acanthamoebae]|nr:hypothetical protein IM40_11460 [Candidatus Paracaedimonas acanthamoebae]
MAIFHFQAGYTSRSGSKSVCAHAAYIAGLVLEDDRTGQIWDYSKRQKSSIFSTILAPSGTPEWVYDAQKLWNAAESFEDNIAHQRFKGHKDPVKNQKSLAAKEKFLMTCKTSYTVMFGLPIEIEDREHQKELAQRLVQACYVDYDLIAQYVIRDKGDNPCLHAIITTRPLLENGTFSKKRFVIDKRKLFEIRAEVARIANMFGQEKGYNYNLDPRSYKEQGINLIPTRKVGIKMKSPSYQRKLLENEDIKRQNIEMILTHPEEIIKVVISGKKSFTQEDIIAEISKHLGEDAQYYAIMKAKIEGQDMTDIMNEIYSSGLSAINKEESLSILESFSAQILSHEMLISIGENSKGETLYKFKG